MASNLDANQCIQEAFDPASGGLKILGTGGTLVTEAFDYVEADYPSATQEIYTFKTGGAGGTVVATVTVDYTDATKANLQSISKS